jgi:hypothetical protein
MKTRHLVFITITAAVAILAAVPLRAAVTVTPAEPPKESAEPPKVAPPKVEPPKTEAPKADLPPGKLVAFRVSETQYLTTGANGVVYVGGEKIGSKQIFTIIDLSGGDLGDGDEVKIQYIPGHGTDSSKANYWVERPDGLKRMKEGDVFKIKKVGTKYAFQAPTGKFVSATVADGALETSDKKESALLVEFVDLSAGIPKPPKKSKADASAAE